MTTSQASEKAKVTPEADEGKEPWQILRDDWNFDARLARTFQDNGIAETLIKLDATGFKISEGDPLLICAIDMDDPNSVAYANAGNYGLAPGQPGHLPWPGGGGPPAPGAPLPAGVAAAPPNALASFLRSLPDVQDKSDGNGGIVFYVPNMGRLHEMPGRLKRQDQFRRIGPVLAGLSGVNPVEPSLVTFYTLDTMRGPPHHYPNFNQTD